jgi:hypothetical protein
VFTGPSPGDDQWTVTDAISQNRISSHTHNNDLVCAQMARNRHLDTLEPLSQNLLQTKRKDSSWRCSFWSSDQQVLVHGFDSYLDQSLGELVVLFILYFIKSRAVAYCSRTHHVYCSPIIGVLAHYPKEEEDQSKFETIFFVHPWKHLVQFKVHDHPQSWVGYPRLPHRKWRVRTFNQLVPRQRKLYKTHGTL